MGGVRALEGRFPRLRFGAPPANFGSALRQAIDPAVAAVFEVEIADLRAPTRRSPRSAFARQVATEVGALFARDRTTVAHACSVVEDRRDDPELDGRLEHLERAVTSLIEALSLRRGYR